MRARTEVDARPPVELADSQQVVVGQVAHRVTDAAFVDFGVGVHARQEREAGRVVEHEIAERTAAFYAERLAEIRARRIGYALFETDRRG